MSEANIPMNQSQLLSEPVSLSAREINSDIDESRPNPPENNPATHSPQVDNLPLTTVKEKPTKPSKEFLKNADWYAIARRLRQHNRQLVQKIITLEKSLSESQQRLETQKRRCSHTDSLVEQQTRELEHFHQEIARLSHELENAYQEHQRQQMLIESLSQQLQTSQERTALLERECSLLQDNYDRQQRQLLKAEKNNRELKIRLQRQQRYTLQFKAALDRCLEVSSEENSHQALDSKVNVQLQAIESWSNYQKTTDSLPIGSILPRKLLANQGEITETQPEKESEIEAETQIASEKTPPEVNEKPQENPPLQVSEDALDSELDRKQPSRNINLTPGQQKVSPQSHRIKNSDQKSKPHRKGFIQLPRLPKFS